MRTARRQTQPNGASSTMPLGPCQETEKTAPRTTKCTDGNIVVGRERQQTRNQKRREELPATSSRAQSTHDLRQKRRRNRADVDGPLRQPVRPYDPAIRSARGPTQRPRAGDTPACRSTKHRTRSRQDRVRKQRSFTGVSAAPEEELSTQSSPPPAPGPGRYIRFPAAPGGVGTNAPRYRPRGFRLAPAQGPQTRGTAHRSTPEGTEIKDGSRT